MRAKMSCTRVMNKCLMFVLSAVLLSAFPGWTYPQSDPDPNRFLFEIENFENWDKKNAIPDNHVLFIGSSSIRLWMTKETFPDLPVVNRGFGGAHISDMLFFIENITLKYEKPSCIVFYCGDNDIDSGKTPERVLSDYQEFVDAVHEKWHGVPFVYISIKPSLLRWRWWSEMSKANNLIKEFSGNNRWLFYADIATPMLGPNGKPRKPLFSLDGLHLNTRGYELWTEIVRPYIDEARKGSR